MPWTAFSGHETTMTLMSSDRDAVAQRTFSSRRQILIAFRHDRPLAYGSTPPEYAFRLTPSFSGARSEPLISAWGSIETSPLETRPRVAFAVVRVRHVGHPSLRFCKPFDLGVRRRTARQHSRNADARQRVGAPHHKPANRLRAGLPTV